MGDFQGGVLYNVPPPGLRGEFCGIPPPRHGRPEGVLRGVEQRETCSTLLRLSRRHRAAEAGDEGALEEFRTDDMEAIEAMIEALEGEESRKLIRLGMMLGQHRILGMGNVFEPAFGQELQDPSEDFGMSSPLGTRIQELS